MAIDNCLSKKISKKRMYYSLFEMTSVYTIKQIIDKDIIYFPIVCLKKGGQKPTNNVIEKQLYFI